MRRACPIVLLALSAVLTACGTSLSVIGTYDEVWDATSTAVRDEAALRARRDVPMPPGRAGGRVRTSVMDPALGAEIEFFAEIDPVGGEEIRKHKVTLFVNQKNESDAQASPDLALRQGAEDVQVRSTRRQDLEKRIMDSIRRQLGREP